ncbi:TonB-dependent receptor [Hymenobacter lapidiphilus]|uniref:TonB-dependent receptor n=1 Tax=Hymenobacter lapidiphilus TaxID=2608003 RepID=A0A7Y7PQQ8_9BACT|nr:TonB-dependent receptor [Hymenobacter lapidiphilus]NVO32291.1 TonB-dependent receptor [Hymenobacter lapidiphilus]
MARASEAPNKGIISGAVRTPDGPPAEFVSIALKGTSLGQMTNGKGRFIFKAPAGSYTLVASMVGYRAVEQALTVTAGQTTTLELQLDASNEQLNEVVVQGVGQNRPYAEPVSSLATRTATPLRDVPQSIQVINKQLLQDRSIQTVAEATKLMAGVNAFSSSQYSDYVLRGFRSSPGNFAYNGIRGDFYQFDQAALTYNLERIEAIKGPASVLFSAGNPGGVINHVTKRAQAAARYEAEFTVGSFNQYRTMLDATGAVSKDNKLLYRAIVGYENTGQLDSRQKIENIFLAPQLQYNFSEKTSLNYELNYSYDDRTMGFQRGVPALKIGEDQWQLDRYPRDFSMIDPRGYSRSRAVSNQFMLSHAFTDKLKLNVLARSMHTRQRQFDVSPGGFSTGAVNDSITMNNRLWTPDYAAYQSTTYLTWDASTGPVRHQLVAGADLTSDGRDYTYATVASQRVSLLNQDFSWATYDGSPVGLAQDEFATSVRERTTLLAGYVQDQITFSHKWKALVGGRLERHFFHNRSNNPGTGELLGRDTLRAFVFSPRAGLVFQPSQQVSLYASYTQGFLPQYGSNRGGGGPFAPERSRQYEVGTKTDWLGGRLIGSVAAYYIQKYDVLANDPTDADGLRLRQIDNVVSKGIETTLQGSITPQLNIIANYAYNDTRTPGDAGFDFNAAGRFPNAPNHNANAWAKYQLTGGVLRGLHLGAGFNYLSERTSFIPALVVPGYTTFDASLGYQRGGLRTNLTLNNLTDTRYYHGVYGPANLWPGNPRSFRLTVGYVL